MLNINQKLIWFLILSTILFLEITLARRSSGSRSRRRRSGSNDCTCSKWKCGDHYSTDSNTQEFEKCIDSKEEYEKFDSSSKTVTCTYSKSCSSGTCSCLTELERDTLIIVVCSIIGVCLILAAYQKLCRRRNRLNHGSASPSNTQSEPVPQTQTEGESEQVPNTLNQETIGLVSMDEPVLKYPAIDNPPPYVSNEQGQTTAVTEQPPPPQYQPMSGQHANPPPPMYTPHHQQQPQQQTYGYTY